METYKIKRSDTEHQKFEQLKRGRIIGEDERGIHKKLETADGKVFESWHDAEDQEKPKEYLIRGPKGEIQEYCNLKELTKNAEEVLNLRPKFDKEGKIEAIVQTNEKGYPIRYFKIPAILERPEIESWKENQYLQFLAQYQEWGET